MAVIGAILGDIAGSQFEFNRPENLDYKHCELFTSRCSYTCLLYTSPSPRDTR